MVPPFTPLEMAMLDELVNNSLNPHIQSISGLELSLITLNIRGLRHKTMYVKNLIK